MSSGPPVSDERRRIGVALEGLGPLATPDVPLRTLTTFRVGGPADVLVRIDSLDDLARLTRVVSSTALPVMVVGQGSNLLVGDDGIRGIVVVLGGDFAATTFPPPHLDAPVPHPDALARPGLEVAAGGAVKLPVLARQAASRGLGGLEWMVGVPGSVGGAVRMNAGGHGSDVAASVISVGLWHLGDDAPVTVAGSDLGLRYRGSNLTDADVVLSAVFQVRPRDASVAETELAEIVRWRREHQPGGANCGSVFTNPPEDSAGRLIDAAGMRGLRIGTASVSEKHANFIQADDNASAADIWALIIEVRRRVFDRFGIALHPEVRTVGFDSRLPPLPPLSTSPVDSNE